MRKAPTAKRGRPLGDKKKESLDLVYLKQTMLLDNVEDLIVEKQREEALKVGVKELVVPYTPSKEQQEVHELLSKYKYGVVVVHRGFGKTWLAINELIRRAWECDAPQGGKFIYIAPEKLQAKATVWKELKYFVRELPSIINESELTVTFPNGSMIMLAGADNPDRLRGQHPHFVVLDEVAQMARETWYGAVYPSLSANRGGALFIGTPKGDNLFRELYEHAQRTRGWFHYLRTVEDTSVFSKEEIEEFMENTPPSEFAQERMCSFDAALKNTYFSDIISDEKRGIVTDVPWDPMLPVITSWDLGLTGSTVIWFAQVDPDERKIVKFIDYYENNQKDAFHYVNIVKSKPYVYDYHILPHDVSHRSWETMRTRIDIFQQHGLKVKIAKKLGVMEGIAMAQALLYTSRMDRTKCREGIAHLFQYRAKQDKITGESSDVPASTVHSHASDAFRVMAVGLKSVRSVEQSKDYAIAGYDYFNFTNAQRHSEADESAYDIWNP